MAGIRARDDEPLQPAGSARLVQGARASLSGQSRRALQIEFSILVAVVALAAGLRFFGLGSQPLWLDEGYSWWDAHQSLKDLWSLVPQCDPHPPLYFVILKFWTDALGDGTVPLRALSACLGVATTIAVICAGREIDRRVGWVAGLLFALTPFQVEFGHEARPYSLLCFGAALVAFGALRIARVSRLHSAGGEQPEASLPPARSASWLGGAWQKLLGSGEPATAGWLSLFAGCVIVLWTNNTSILIIAAVCTAFLLLLALDFRSRHLFKPLLLVVAVVILLWLPYIPTLLEQARGVESDFWIPKPEGWRFANELRFVVSLNAFDAVWWACAALGGGLILMWRRGAWRQAILLGFLIAVPVGLNYALSMTIKPIFIARALIGIAPAVVIVTAAAVMLIKAPWMRYATLTAAVAAHAMALGLWYSNYQGKEPWDRIATEVAAGHALSLSGKSDVVVLLAANELALPLSHAFEDIHATVPLQGAPANFPSPGLSARYPSGKCAPSVQGQNLAEIGRAVRGHHTIYFITRKNNVYDPGNGIARFLLSLGLKQTAITTYNPGSLEVHEFVAPQNAPRALAHVQLSPGQSAEN
jgi:mannosyltransferase